MSELELAMEKVCAILVDTFGLPEAEALQRLNLWRARQHNLEGDALEALLPALSPDEQAQQLLLWALKGEVLEQNLRSGAANLGIKLDPKN